MNALPSVPRPPRPPLTSVPHLVPSAEPLSESCKATSLASMGRITFQLSDELQDFIEQQITAGRFESPQHLITELLQRELDRAHLKSQLLEGARSGPGLELDEAFFDELQQLIEDSDREQPL